VGVCGVCWEQARYISEFMYRGASVSVSRTWGKKGDELITTTMTFCSAVNVILYVGAKPVLVDVNKVSFNLDVETAIDRISNRTKVILQCICTGSRLEVVSQRGDKSCSECGACYRSKM